MSGDQAQMHLSNEVGMLKQEREILRKKIEDMQGVIDMKNLEIDNLQKSLAAGGGMGGNPQADQDAIRNLAQTNERLMRELTKLQDQMRVNESLDAYGNSLNNTNSMLRSAAGY